MKVLLFSRTGDPDGRVARCAEAVRQPDSPVRVVECADLLATVTGLWRELRNSGSALEELALVGHGGPGWLTLGDHVLTAGSDALRVLTYLKDGGVLHEATTVVVLGCCVGSSPPAGDSASGDGELLGLALRRRLGCTIQLAVETIWEGDFGTPGFVARHKLRQQLSERCCGLAHLAESAAEPRKWPVRS